MPFTKMSWAIAIIMVLISGFFFLASCKTDISGKVPLEESVVQSTQNEQETLATQVEVSAEDTIEEEAEAEENTEQEQSPETEGLKDEITLAQGWALTDAISAKEVAEITGEDMTYFPEAGSAAQDGKPMGSYMIEGKEDSKIGFYVFVNGGIAEFENPRNFMIEGSDREISEIGDKAYLCDFDNNLTAIVIIKGETVIRVLWNTEIYSGFEKEELGKALAGKLMLNMYK
ncbi:MAG: hypothetical protein JW997_02175 [Actinobacteria bacterium]|nr:hypothetical protein [Actinomycetota bacterium]